MFNNIKESENFVFQYAMNMNVSDSQNDNIMMFRSRILTIKQL